MKKSKFLKLKPMLLHEVDNPFNDDDYIFEIKFDGIRALILIDKGKIIIKSRRNVILNDIYPELLELVNINNETCIFDGEIVLMDNGFPSFSKLQERLRLKSTYKINLMQENYPVTFVCFDILYKNKDLTNKTLLERKDILNKFNDTKRFVKTKYYNDGINLFKVVKKGNLEGIIAKKKNSLYSYGIRTKDWLKIKNFQEEEFYICGYEETKSKSIVSAILGECQNNKYYYVGKVVLGHKNDVFHKIRKMEKISNYLENFTEVNATFIKPEYMLKINFLERTKNNLLRHPFIK